MSMIPRILETQVLAVGKNYPIVTITGPRQSGKTTLDFFAQGMSRPETTIDQWLLTGFYPRIHDK